VSASSLARQREEPIKRNSAMNTEDEMPDTDQHDDIIKNKDTRSRRAWVSRAIDGVRRRLERGEGIPPADPVAADPERPRLTVVPNTRKP
jgi:hypothetical protein